MQETKETWVRSLGQEDSLEMEMATHSSILVWKIPWTEEPEGSPCGCKELDMTERLTLIPPKATYRFSEIHMKIPTAFEQKWKANPQIHMEFQGAQIAYVICKNESFRTHASWFQNLLQNYNHQNYGTGMNVKVKSCLTLCDPMACSLPGSSVHGIFQAIVLEWIAISFFSKGSSQSRDRTQVSCIVDRRFTVWAIREVQVLA